MSVKLGHPVADLFETRIAAINQDFADEPSVRFFFAAAERRILAEDEPREILLGALTERLVMLGCVDAREADGVLSVRVPEHRYRIAVGYADDTPRKSFLRQCRVRGS